MTQEGNGVGRVDGIAVFVPRTAIGDRVRAKIVKVQPRYCFGIVQELLTPSPARCDADCEAFSRCGGCSFRHITYEEELSLKAGWVRETMRRIGKIDLEPEEILPSPSQEGYRNKAIYPIAVQDGKLCIGFYAKRSHRIVEADCCRLHPPLFGDIVGAVRGWIEAHRISVYDENAHKGLLRALFLRRAEVTGEVMVCLIANGSRLPEREDLVGRLLTACPDIASIILNENRDKTNVLLGKTCRTLYGADTITDVLCGVRVTLSPLSFYQVNRAGAQQLYRLAAQFAELQDGETLVDLYCGAGTIGLSMAAHAGQLIGVEVVPAAVENARKNAAANGIANARFLCGDAAAAARTLEEEGLRPDCVIVDPPRKGLDAALIGTIARMNPSRVVMVSCNSATAARDAALFAEAGYRPTRIRAVDMFPRTGHVECVVLMTKADG